MTHATKAIFFWMLSDYIKVSNISTDQQLFTDSDLEAAMDKIETINFHEEKEVAGIKFWCYNAGHVLGAAMFMLEIAGVNRLIKNIKMEQMFRHQVKILYTGDFSREEDRHLPQAEIPNMRPDVVIVEATYGTHIHEPRETREARYGGIIIINSLILMADLYILQVHRNSGRNCPKRGEVFDSSFCTWKVEIRHLVKL